MTQCEHPNTPKSTRDQRNQTIDMCLGSDHHYTSKSNARFKPGTFFVGSSILRANQELTLKAVSKFIFSTLKNNKT